ncbi:hypothetical protein EMIHUDRAFT_420248 [Emiliania huxleyi CCMP1516]|uniref:Uncharacterized protein n=3 Tax=Emiliania huxleyi TaxID=2903 RepID=A0A0D3L1G9_EMIH1|nr:hypothetical protein EMIHUDRAFT_420248 [Emiliania huxleyi CCMP1516]EOD41854.1 hypothetical protein EMIHUDRAFT_420248 [Emiliania huxleyi CCMP1516]|mmetsp:Transcript_33716/g.111523  ORF Transcript_33716/g.111523 Transcript_33716/m.111523 type:complete len:379 (-) Transcript_33716:384-1520(-)|eukprot:XP_005794283.1 hypothetical protein EMIHUDRAFT_420248 [Emiliania huxleyi CCMP1516]
MQRFCVLALLGLSLCAARPSDRLPMLAKRRIDASAGFSEVPLEPLDEWVANHEVRPRLNPRRGAGLKSQQTLLAARAPYVVKGRSLAYRRAIIATIWSFVATIAFGVGVVLPMKGSEGCINFFTAFLVEKSLSVDNLFVFLMIFDYFKVPEQYTQRVLKWGILTALALRAVMIGVGVAVVQRFRPVLLVFALVLVVSAIKMLMPEHETDLADNAMMKIATRFVDATDYYDGEKFMTKVNGVRKATPLLVVLVMIELSDVIFAVDSIPAVVGITSDAMVVYSSNVFALMALRSLYLLLSKSVESLYYLRHAVALILFFVGAKMVVEFFHFHVSAFTSLAVIVGLLTGGVAASLLRNRRMTAAAASSEGQGAKRHGVDAV